MKYFVKLFFIVEMFFYSMSCSAMSVIVEKPNELRKNEAAYRDKFINLKGVYAKAKIFSVVNWDLGYKKGVLIFLQHHEQCRVVNFDLTDTVSYANNGILLDSPWCRFKKIPVSLEKKDYSVVEYKISVHADVFSEKIMINKKTGFLCSNSFGNTDFQCD